MKIITAIAAVALLGTAVPAIAQDVTNSQGEAIGSPTPVVPTPIAPSSSSLSGVTSIRVLAVPDQQGLQLDGGPDSSLVASARVADAVKQSGYSGAPILGYNIDGSSLTVYVKAA